MGKLFNQIDPWDGYLKTLKTLEPELRILFVHSIAHSPACSLEKPSVFEKVFKLLPLGGLQTIVGG